MLVFLIIIFCISIQIKAIIDIIKKMRDSKNDGRAQNIYLGWLLIVIFLSFIGAILYFKIEKNESKND